MSAFRPLGPVAKRSVDLALDGMTYAEDLDSVAKGLEALAAGARITLRNMGRGADWNRLHDASVQWQMMANRARYELERRVER